MAKINTGYSLNECPPMKETMQYSIHLDDEDLNNRFLVISDVTVGIECL